MDLKIKYTDTIVLFILLFFTLLFQHCSSADEAVPPPQNPVISGLSKITLQSPLDQSSVSGNSASTDQFQYKAPDNVTDMIIFLCEGTGCSSQVITDNRVDLNASQLAAGNSTSYTMGTSSTNVKGLYAITSGTFDTSSYFNPGGSVTYEWFILGYANEVLVAASPAWQVTIAW